MKIKYLLAVTSVAFFVVSHASAQNAGTVTSHAFAIGKGPGQTGFTSLLCAATELAIGQTSANPACHAMSGDVTMNATGVTAIGALKVTNGMLAGSIAASKLVGTDIATVGTVTTGTWNGTTIAVANGGTGATTAASARTNLGVAIGSNVQAWDADLDCIAAISTTGVISRTGAGTCAVRTITAPAAGITVANGDGVSGNPTLSLANDLAALEGLSGTGIAARTATDTWTTRTVTGTANEITVTNGDGVAGNPTLSLPTALTFTGKTVTGGTFSGPAISSPTGLVKGDVGLGNVDNTSDATKWAATKTLTNTTYDTAGTGNSFSINGVAATANTGTGAVVRANSPALTGSPTATTASPSDNSTRVATTAYVDAQVAGGVSGVGSYNGRSGVVTALGTDVPLRGYLAGLTLSTAGSSATFGMAAGVATDSGNTAMMQLSSAVTKTTGAWAVGSGNGALDTGTIANNTWYHAFLIKRPDTGVVDVLISVSAASPTLPTNYTLFRRIGSMKTTGAGVWADFRQDGDEFLWASPAQDVSADALSTTSKLYTLSVPPGVIVTAKFRILYGNTAGQTFALIQSPNESTQTANSPSGNINLRSDVANQYASSQMSIKTDTNSRIRAISSAASNNQLWINTYGWVDRRGRDD